MNKTFRLANIMTICSTFIVMHVRKTPVHDF